MHTRYFALTATLFLMACGTRDEPASAASAPTPAPEAVAARPPDTPTPPPSPAETVDPIEAHIDHIRTRYSAALGLPSQRHPFSCDDDPVSGMFETRLQGTTLVWARYSIGYEHGGESVELLVENDRILFVVKEQNMWVFDTASDVPEGNGGTVDSLEQSRYYFQDGQLVRALAKSATARSILKQSLDVELGKAINEPIQNPDGTAVLEVAQKVLKAHRDQVVTTNWCGL